MARRKAPAPAKPTAMDTFIRAGNLRNAPTTQAPHPTSSQSSVRHARPQQSGAIDKHTTKRSNSPLLAPQVSKKYRSRLDNDDVEAS